MIGAHPFPTLTKAEGKRLTHQHGVYQRDYPASSDEDLAAIWHDEQSVLAADTWLAPYLSGDAWRREVPRAIAHLRRAEAGRIKAKAFRAAAKERHLDRQPATERQLALIDKLAKAHPDKLSRPDGPLSKLAASRVIERVRPTR